jgi:hypothetical protein
VKDKRGFTIGMVDVSMSDLTPFQVQKVLDDFIRDFKIDDSTKFSVMDFQKYLYKVYKIRTVEYMFDVLNLRV